ncbi:MAG: hypothetical protein RRB13_01310 [bacterium]|nr:hypothetical protein [bacterium]
MQTIMTDIVFLVALLLVGYKTVNTWRQLFPKGFDVWLAERKQTPPDEG